MNYPTCPLCGHAHKPLDTSKDYRIHGGDPDTSPKLAEVLKLGLDAGANGITGKGFEQITGGIASHSDIAAIRAWAIKNRKPLCVPFARPEGTTDNGCRVYRYFIFQHKTTPAPVQLPSGELAMF